MSDLFDPPLVPDRFLRVAVERAVDRYPGGLLYSVPTSCESVRTGHRVLVPLGRGNAEVPGTVVDQLGAEALAEDGVAVDRIKPMIRRSDDLPALPGELLELARWIASYYVCPIGITLANLVPAAVRKGVGTATRLLISPHPSPPDPRPRLGSKQRAVLDAVLATPAEDLPIASHDLTERSGVGAPFLIG